MTQIKDIHELHMELSYNPDHDMYKYLENETKKKNIGYKRQFVIATNQTMNIDLGIYLIKGLLYPNRDEFIKKIKLVNPKIIKKIIDDSISNIIQKVSENKSIDSNDSILHKSEPLTNVKEICDKKNMTLILCELKQKYIQKISKYIKDNDIDGLILWIYDQYANLKNIYHNKIIDKDGKLRDAYISEYLFFGTIEWFHLLLTKIMYDDLVNNSNFEWLIINGEIQFIDTEIMSAYSLNEFFEFITSEYNSHAILYLINTIHNTMSIYDPDNDIDHTDKKENNLLSEILGKTIYKINIDPSVQSMTDDPYCIFHCIWFIIRFIDVIPSNNKDIDKLDKFMEYINLMSMNTTKADTLYFIKDITLKIRTQSILNKDKLSSLAIMNIMSERKLTPQQTTRTITPQPKQKNLNNKTKYLRCYKEDSFSLNSSEDSFSLNSSHVSVNDVNSEISDTDSNDNDSN